MTPAHVLYQDIKPYDVPSSLDALHGPTAGTITLPWNVYWGPNPVVDLDTDAGIEKAYRVVVREGRTADQEALLDRDTLVRVWPDLMLPARCRRAWETRFPELGA